jgi:hypothetical protein
VKKTCGGVERFECERLGVGHPMEVSRRKAANGVSSRTSNKIPMAQILELDTVKVPESDSKFAGCVGVSVRLLMGAAKSGCGIFTAGDGMQTEQIPFEVLGQAIVMHTDSSGQPISGGPLRLWFPAECGLVWGSGNNLSVKDVIGFELTVPPSTA